MADPSPQETFQQDEGLTPPSAQASARRAHPRGPEVLPDFSQGRRGPKRASGLFDGDGRPMVASAREIAPDEDNPLSALQRLGERLAWTLLGGARFWPFNARNNVLLFYLLGRARRGAFVRSLLFLSPFLFLLGIDVTIHVWLYVEQSPTGATAIQLAVLLLGFPLLGIVAGLLVAGEMRAFAERLPLEEIATTRIEPLELLYGLFIRPLATMHGANLVVAILLLAQVLVYLVFYFESQSVYYGEPELAAEILTQFIWTVFYGVGRFLLFAMAINGGASTMIRAGLFLRDRQRAVRAGLLDWLRFQYFFPLLLPGGIVLLVLIWQNAGCFFGFFGTIGLLMYYLYCWRFSLKRASEVMRKTAAFRNEWWLRAENDWTKLPDYVRESI